VVSHFLPCATGHQAALRRALEAAGVEFIEENGGGEASDFATPRGSPTNSDHDALTQRSMRCSAGDVANMPPLAS
jgi:hypothetical protein